MDRKSTIILVITGILFLLWTPIVNKIFPPQVLTNAPTAGTNIIVAATNAAIAATLSSAGTNALPAAFTNAPSAKEETIVVESNDTRYHFTSHGGGIKLIELKEFKSIVGCDVEKLATNPPASLNKNAPLPIFTVAGADAGMGDNVFRLTSTGQTVRAEKAFTNGLLIVKEFQILSNYQLKATIRWENHAKQPVLVPNREVAIGAATPMGAFDDLTMIGLDWFDGKKAHRNPRTGFEPSSFLFFYNRPAKTEYVAGSSNVVWAAAHNQFFTTIVTPQFPAERVVGHAIDLPMPTEADLRGDKRTVVRPRGIAGGLAYQAIAIPADQSFVQQFDLYAGPKEYKTLQRLSKDVDLVMNLEGFWGWFAKMLLIAMNGIHAMGATYGWAIVLITIILKVVFYPLTAASTRSMKRMSALQPQMKAIQDKYKDDPQKMNQKLQEFMREHKINPLGSCLPLLLTIPIFAGFYFMLRSAIELRGQHFLWACDLSQPDTLFNLGPIPFNLFAALMVITMMWQSHMTPPSPGADPVQQKMMRYMPLIIVPFIYNQASGLTLYWTVQNLLSILQMKLTQDRPEDDPANANKPKSGPAAPPRRKTA